MTNQFIGMQLFIVFEHVWTESDTGGKEYSFVNVFSNLDDAQDYCKRNRKTKSIYGDLVIEPLIFDENAEQTGELYWEPRYNSWINKGAFKSVNKEKILHILQERKFVCTW